jgi:hypothetical protein
MVQDIDRRDPRQDLQTEGESEECLRLGTLLTLHNDQSRNQAILDGSTNYFH